MKTRFLFQGVEVEESIRSYILKRLDRLTKFVPGSSLFEIEINQEKKKKFRVEVMINAEGELFRAVETTESIEGSIDLIVDELESQMTKQKDREHDLILRGARSVKKMLVVDDLARF